MQIFHYSIIAVTAALGLNTAVQAVPVTTIRELPENAAAQVSGQVVDVVDSNTFILADHTGQIEVNTHKPFNVNTGNPVTVRGYIDHAADVSAPDHELDQSRIVFISYNTEKTEPN